MYQIFRNVNKEIRRANTPSSTIPPMESKMRRLTKDLKNCKKRFEDLAKYVKKLVVLSWQVPSVPKNHKRMGSNKYRL